MHENLVANRVNIYHKLCNQNIHCINIFSIMWTCNLCISFWKLLWISDIDCVSLYQQLIETYKKFRLDFGLLEKSAKFLKAIFIIWTVCEWEYQVSTTAAETCAHEYSSWWIFLCITLLSQILAHSAGYIYVMYQSLSKARHASDFRFYKQNSCY